MNDYYRQLTAGHCKGELSETEAVELREWIESDFTHLEEFHREVQRRAEAGAVGRLNEVEIALQDLRARTALEIPVRKGSMRKVTLWKWMASAAAVLLVVSLGWIMMQSAVKPGAFPEYTLISNPKGKRSKIVLPDSSVAFLNAESSIRFEKKFAGNNRTVVLRGEAFFEVRHLPERPFVVKSGQLSTVVLGTSFDVRAYPNELAKVTVSTGKVGVMAGAENKLLGYLTPGQQLSYTSKGSYTVTSGGEKSTAPAWTQNRMVFYGASLEQIAADMERWYNVKIVLSGPSSSECRFSFKLDNQSLSSAMALLKELSGVRYRISGNTIYMVHENCR